MTRSACSLSVQGMVVCPSFICSMEWADALVHVSATPDESAHPLTTLLVMYILPK